MPIKKLNIFAINPQYYNEFFEKLSFLERVSPAPDVIMITGIITDY